MDEIAKVFSDLVLSDDVLEQVGQAIRAGFGFFLYGDSGNGKTSLAERVSRAFGKTIWIPRSLSVDGMIIRLLTPAIISKSRRRIRTDFTISSKSIAAGSAFAVPRSWWAAN